MTPGRKWALAGATTVVAGTVGLLSLVSGPGGGRDEAGGSPLLAPAVAPRSSALPNITPSELAWLLVRDTGPLVPPGYVLAGTLCNGAEVWCRAEDAGQVAVWPERVTATEGTLLHFVSPWARAADGNGDGVLDGRDVQAFVRGVVP